MKLWEVYEFSEIDADFGERVLLLSKLSSEPLRAIGLSKDEELIGALDRGYVVRGYGMVVDRVSEAQSHVACRMLTDEHKGGGEDINGG